MNFKFLGSHIQIQGGRVAIFADVKESTIYDAIRKHRRKLLKGEKRTVKELIALYESAKRELEKRLAAVVSKIETASREGSAVGASWVFQQNEWAFYISELETKIDAYSKIAYAKTGEAILRSVELGNDHATQLIRTAGVRGGFYGLNESVVQNLIGAMSNSSPLRSLFESFGTDAVSEAIQIMSTGLIAGDNPRTIGRALSKAVNKLPPKRAALIARTESIRAYRESQIQNYAANSNVVTAMRIVSARDKRTCFMCIARDGQILELSEAFGQHPGCRCTLSPVVKYLDRPRIDGETWLRSQPEAVQRDKLGRGRYELWSTGKVSLADMAQIENSSAWGQSTKPRTLLNLQSDIQNGSAGRKFNTTPPPESQPGN